MLTCCTAIVRKTFLQQVEGFDDRAIMGVGDWNLWLKLAMVCEFDYVSEHLAVHVFQGDNYSLNDEKTHEAEIICLNKIAPVAAKYEINVNWSLIEHNLHIRYANSYIFSGFYNLAGNTFLRANKEKSNNFTLFKWLAFKFVPNYVWHFYKNVNFYSLHNFIFEAYR